MAAIEHRAPGDVADRLVAAALRCVARWGLAKTTLDDIARDAGCSRATLYRVFPGGKEALLAAVLDAELARLEHTLTLAVAETADLEDAVVAAVTTLAREVDGHAALQFLLAHEPELVLPHLAFRALDALLARVAVAGAPLFRRFLGSDDEAAGLAEWLTRIVISHTCSPSAGVQLTDGASVQRLVRAFVLPGLLVTA